MEKQSYPKMLYRPALGEGNMVWGARVDTKTVHDKNEDLKARTKFWLAQPMIAVRISKLNNFFINFMRSHSKELVAAILALIVGIILFNYQQHIEQSKLEGKKQISISKIKNKTILTSQSTRTPNLWFVAHV
jgi:hypothetical protein